MEGKLLVEIGSYKWATLAASYGGNAYSGIIVPESFSGVTCRLDIESSGLVAVNDLSFDVFNSSGAITSEHDETFHNAVLAAHAAIKKAEGRS